MATSGPRTDLRAHVEVDVGRPAEEGRKEHIPRLPYNPALDGIRGLAVLAVMVFHHDRGSGWLRGGFLAVSTFFTLSGFLITSLLLAEHRRSGRISITGFYARRLRRLLRASALTLALAMVTALVTIEAWERRLPGDVMAAALHMANWRFLFADQSYADLFQDSQSLVLHFWSLAIEEQFYLVFPLLTVGTLVLCRGSLRAFAVVLTALVLTALVLTLLMGDDPNTVYYATPIRAGEILIGSLLAVLVARGWFLRRAGLAPLIAAAGLVALAVQVSAWWSIHQQHWSFRWGGLLAYGVTSAALVLATHVPGPVRRLMAWEPLRLLGLISYGVYLFHWPLFRLMTENRVGRVLEPFNLVPSGWSLLVVRLVVVIGLAAVSYWWLESPIRRGVRPRSHNAPVLGAGAVAGVIGLALVVPAVSAPPGDPMAEALAWLDRNRGPARATDLPPDARVGVAVGDSTMVMTAVGLASWGGDNGHRLVIADNAANVGCGIGVGGEVEFAGERSPLVDRCRTWRDRMLDAVDDTVDRYGRVDVAVVQAGPWDVADRRLPDDERWRHIGDPVYDDYLRQEMEAVVEPLLDRGITVVWLTAPLVDPARPQNRDRPELAPARLERFNRMVDELAERPGVVAVDLADHVASLPRHRDEQLRPDGVHFSPASSREVADWLAPAVLAASEQR